MAIDCLVVGVEHESRVCAVLAVKTTKDQNRRRVNLVCHSEITRYPVGLVFDVYYFPDIFLDVVALTDISDFLWRKFYATRKHVNELGIENAASGAVSSYVEVRHSDPFISTDVVVLASAVKVLCIVSSNHINAVFFALVDGSKIRSGVIQISSVLKHSVLFNILKHPVAADVVLMPTSDAVEAAVVRNDRAAKLGNIVFKVHKVFGLFVRNHIIEVDVFVAPFKIVDDSFVSQLLLHDEQILEKVNNALVDVEMIELCYHRLLVFEVLLK